MRLSVNMFTTLYSYCNAICVMQDWKFIHTFGMHTIISSVCLRSHEPKIQQCHIVGSFFVCLFCSSIGFFPSMYAIALVFPIFFSHPTKKGSERPKSHATKYARISSSSLRLTIAEYIPVMNSLQGQAY